MLRHVAPVRTDISEELTASIIRVTRIGELFIDCHPDDPGPKFLRHISSYKSHML
jgi:hypothetical protein